MRSFDELIKYFLDNDIKLRIEDEKLKYNAPAGSITPGILAEMKYYKNNLIEYISSGNHDEIVPYTGEGPVPLSFAHYRLWFLNKLEGDNHAYNLPFPVKLEGDLNTVVLLNAVKEVLLRHTILRTSFPESDGNPFQKVNDISDKSFGMFTAGGNSAEAKWLWINSFIADKVKVSFNLEKGPLFSIDIIHVDANTNVLVMVFHHLLLDGWSINIVLDEIEKYYDLLINGKNILPAPHLQYSDYTIWHNKWLESAGAKKQLDYWKNELMNLPGILQMPFTSSRPAVQTLNGATTIFEIDEITYNGLKKIASANDASLFMVLYAAFSVLLYRYTGTKDIILGTTIANRNRSELEELVGLLANTIAIRTNLSGNPSFIEYLGTVKKKMLSAYENQDIPFEKVVEEVNPKRSLSFTPVFQILFELQEIQKTKASMPGIKVTPIEPENTASKYDINLLMLLRDGILTGNFEYNTDLFSEDSVNRIINHFRQILYSIVQNPDTKIGHLNYITEKEKSALLAWNSNKQEFPVNESYYNLFSVTAEKYYSHIAAAENSNQVTYSELKQKADLLSSVLLNNGIKNGDVVAVLHERGINYLVSILAVLKCGAAFLPLNPRHPLQRHIQILNQAKPSALISEKSFAGTINELLGADGIHGLPVIYPEDKSNSGSGKNSYPLPNISPDDSAYVIFTSGSTGSPKGAIVKQEGMINHLYAKIKDLEITENDIVAQNASQCFDISVWQYLAPLLKGACVEIISDEMVLDAAQFINKLNKQGITILEVVPSFMSVLLETMKSHNISLLGKLRWLIPTGEALPPELAKEWLTRFPGIPLMNAYGPTECSDDVTHYKMFSIDDVKFPNVPVGMPIPNVNIYILDENLTPAAPGVIGEIFVGGICVGKGYLNDSEKTKAAFINIPFNQNRILYRTGDIGRFLPDGSIEFCGRKDMQVKIRGFRIEPGEIEAVLSSLNEIKEAVVIPAKDGNELWAYVVPAGSETLVPENIKALLKEQLPDYMIPAFIIQLDKIPLTANGKTDFSSLPVPAFDSKTTSLPQTETEKRLSEIWIGLLNIQNIGMDDDFFELGGHSLLAMRVLTKIKEVFNLEISLKSIFEKPSLHMLSQHIDTLLWLRESQVVSNTDDTESFTL